MRKNCLSKKKIHQKKFFSQEIWPKKMSVQKIFRPKRNVGPKKFCSEKKFWSEKLVGWVGGKGGGG